MTPQSCPRQSCFLTYRMMYSLSELSVGAQIPSPERYITSNSALAQIQTFPRVSFSVPMTPKRKLAYALRPTTSTPNQFSNTTPPSSDKLTVTDQSNTSSLTLLTKLINPSTMKTTTTPTVSPLSEAAPPRTLSMIPRLNNPPTPQSLCPLPSSCVEQRKHTSAVFFLTKMSIGVARPPQIPQTLQAPPVITTLPLASTSCWVISLHY